MLPPPRGSAGTSQSPNPSLRCDLSQFTLHCSREATAERHNSTTSGEPLTPFSVDKTQWEPVRAEPSEVGPLHKLPSSRGAPSSRASSPRHPRLSHCASPSSVARSTLSPSPPKEHQPRQPLLHRVRQILDTADHPEGGPAASPEASPKARQQRKSLLGIEYTATSPRFLQTTDFATLPANPHDGEPDGGAPENPEPSERSLESPPPTPKAAKATQARAAFSRLVFDETPRLELEGLFVHGDESPTSRADSPAMPGETPPIFRSPRATFTDRPSEDRSLLCSPNSSDLGNYDLPSFEIPPAAAPKPRMSPWMKAALAAIPQSQEVTPNSSLRQPRSGHRQPTTLVTWLDYFDRVADRLPPSGIPSAKALSDCEARLHRFIPKMRKWLTTPTIPEGVDMGPLKQNITQFSRFTAYLSQIQEKDFTAPEEGFNLSQKLKELVGGLREAHRAFLEQKEAQERLQRSSSSCWMTLVDGAIPGQEGS